MTIETIEDFHYRVVVNQEGQYSLWPKGKSNALGWADTGFAGTKSECLCHIRQTWTDMCPLSLRKSLSDKMFPANAQNIAGPFYLAA